MYVVFIFTRIIYAYIVHFYTSFTYNMQKFTYINFQATSTNEALSEPANNGHGVVQGEQESQKVARDSHELAQNEPPTTTLDEQPLLTDDEQRLVIVETHRKSLVRLTALWSLYLIIHIICIYTIFCYAQRDNYLDSGSN